MSSGMEIVGEVRAPLAICLLCAWLVVFLCVVYGIKSSGKVSVVVLGRLHIARIELSTG